MEGHTAPGTLLQVPPLVLDVVHLGEDGPGVGGDQAGAPDEEDDPLGSAHTGPGVECQGVTDGLVPEHILIVNNLLLTFKIPSDLKFFNFERKLFLPEEAFNIKKLTFKRNIRATSDELTSQ